MLRLLACAGAVADNPGPYCRVARRKLPCIAGLPKSGLERANPHFKSAGLSYNRHNKQ
jgi:hypothetical protein